MARRAITQMLGDLAWYVLIVSPFIVSLLPNSINGSVLGMAYVLVFIFTLSLIVTSSAYRIKSAYKELYRIPPARSSLLWVSLIWAMLLTSPSALSFLIINITEWNHYLIGIVLSVLGSIVTILLHFWLVVLFSIE